MKDKNNLSSAELEENQRGYGADLCNKAPLIQPSINYETTEA
tara:strand:- start:913 stop:1038 length:126 start_codon:yes stop_codon:yes gene_type:complete